MFYFLITLIATLVGAISGIGGSVILKPILDLTTSYDVITISLLSSIIVFCMAFVAILKYSVHSIKFQARLSFLLAGGSILGGLLGEGLLQFVIRQLANQELVKMIQILGFTFLMVLVLVFINFLQSKKKFHLQSAFLIVGVGLLLGTISTFLGIGGGPFNVIVLSLLFSMNLKEASMNSMILILVSQIAKLINVSATQDLKQFDFSLLTYMIPASILGGYLGSKFHIILSSKQILLFLNFTIFFILLINGWNLFHLIFLKKF